MWSVTSEALPLGDLLVRTANNYPRNIAVALPGEEHTYAELLKDSILVARGLAAMKVRRGDHIGIIAPNSYEFVVGLFGTALAGAVSVPLSVRSTPRELAYVIPHAELKVVLATDLIRDHADTIQRLCDALPGLSESDHSAPLSLEIAPHLRHVALLRGESRPGVAGFDHFSDLAETVPAETVNDARSRVRVRDTGVILYTSGTTSHPKGCLLSHESLTRATLARPDEAFGLSADPTPPIMWCAPPLFHSAAIQGLLYCIHLGGTFLTDVYLDGSRAVELSKKFQVTTLWGMFMAAMRSLIDAENFQPADFAQVTSMMTVGSPADVRELQEVFPKARLVNGLGMTELAGWFSLSAAEDTPEERSHTQGKPLRGVEIKILDPESREPVSAGRPGELLIRSYSIMLGYFRDPVKTAETIDSEGWLHTGDLVSQTNSGHLRFEGRIKDMLKVGGENVPTAEIETYLCEHPDVHIAEVVALPDPRLEEVPVAFVQLAKGSNLTADELIQFCRGNLATFKIPRIIFFKTEEQWPMSSTKISKVALRSEAIERSKAHV